MREMPPGRFSFGTRVELSLARHLGPMVIRALGRSIRWTWKVKEGTARRLADGSPVIYAHWHGRLLPLVYTHRDLGVRVLVSQNKDGELITSVIERMGFGTVRGSTSRGARAALRSLIRVARDGNSVAITPDGPRGPIYEVQDGVVLVAAMSGVPVVPTAAGVDRAWVLRSWDRFVVPRPFARGAVVMTDPIDVPPDAPRDLPGWRALIRDRLLEATWEADRVAAGKSSDDA